MLSIREQLFVFLPLFLPFPFRRRIISPQVWGLQRLLGERWRVVVDPAATRDRSVLFLFVEEKRAMVGKVGGRVVGGICLIRETFTFENVQDFERDAT